MTRTRSSLAFSAIPATGAERLGRSARELLDVCESPPYRILISQPKQIPLSPAKRIASSPAKWIARTARAGVEPTATGPGWFLGLVEVEMSARRKEMHRLQELVRLHRMGRGAREVARLLGMGPNTERQYREALAAAGLLAGEPGAVPELEVLKAAVLAHAPPKPAPQQQSSLVWWQPEIEKLLDAGLKPTAVHGPPAP